MTRVAVDTNRFKCPGYWARADPDLVPGLVSHDAYEKVAVLVRVCFIEAFVHPSDFMDRVTDGYLVEVRRAMYAAKTKIT
jgi:hypothetical protein